MYDDQTEDFVECETAHEEVVPHYEKKFEDIVTDLKVAINNLVWTYLPGKTTLDEADKVACLLLEGFGTQWDLFELKNKGNK